MKAAPYRGRPLLFFQVTDSVTNPSFQQSPPAVIPILFLWHIFSSRAARFTPTFPCIFDAAPHDLKTPGLSMTSET
jgi:hypothetical protein